MSDDDDGDSFRKIIDLELSKREEELRRLEELREGIGFAPRRSLMRTPPGGFGGESAGVSAPPIREESMPPVQHTPPAQTGKRALTSPQETQGPRRRKGLSRAEEAPPPISGIMSAPAPAPSSSVGVVSTDSPRAGSPPEAASTPEKRSGLAALDKTQLIDEVYQAVKGISAVANATNKLNMADKGAIAGYNQDILAVVAALNVRLAEAEHAVTAMKLQVASMELQQVSAASVPDPARPVQIVGSGRLNYAATLKLPNGKPQVAIEQRGPAVLFYPKNSEELKSSEETLKELREKIQPAESGIRVEGVRRVGNAGVVVRTASPTAAQKLKAAAPPTLRAADPRSRRPLVALRNLSGDPKPEEVLADLHRVNMEEDPNWSVERLKKEACFAFKKGRRGGRSTTVVYEVSAALRDKLVGMGRVYIGWDAVEVCDFVRVTCCSRCQQYGHPEKHCRAAGMVCGKCGDSGHKAEECQSDVVCCATCKRFKRPEAKSHRTAAMDCPGRLFAEKQVINMTQYA